jgi:hypothetical protein
MEAVVSSLPCAVEAPLQVPDPTVRSVFPPTIVAEALVVVAEVIMAEMPVSTAI